MGSLPTKRIPTDVEPNVGSAAETVPCSEAPELTLTVEDIRELRAFFLLLDRWEREIGEQ